MATYWENSCSFGLRYVSWYKCLIVSLVFSHLGFWSGNLFLTAPFPDLCLLVPFYWLKEKNPEIFFIQETYWTEEILSNIVREWGSKILLSQGTYHSKGTAILFNKNISFDLLNVHKSEDGRMILANIKYDDKHMTLINIYALTIKMTEKTFLIKF